MPAPLRVLRLAREIAVDSALGLVRVGGPLLAIALTSFAAQHLLTRWAGPRQSRVSAGQDL